MSVEHVDEAIRATEYPNVQSVQIIFNMFRLKPAERVLPVAQSRSASASSRASRWRAGCSPARCGRDSQFAAADHRNFNRHGEAFDAGETFSGVDYDDGLRAVEELRDLVPAGATLAELALRWILMFPEVTAAIPGARNASQAENNARAADLPPLSAATMDRVREVYDRHFRGAIHDRW